MFIHFLRRTIGLVILLISLSINGQNSRVVTQEVKLQVAGSALLAVYGPAVELQLAGASQAGAVIAQSVENSSTRLRMSSLVNNQEKRSILAKISEALVGTQLYLELLQPNTNFVYPENMGTLKGQQLLDNENDVTLVEGIGTCWSGITEDDGYVIKYTYKAIPSAPVLKNSTITVTFTISLVPSDSDSKN
jgi:hypothetical protein